MTLDNCQFPDQQNPENLDKAQGCDPEPSLKNVGMLDKDQENKVGYGHEANCDPMMSGQIVDDMRKPPNRNYVHKYWKAMRSVNEAVVDLFRDITAIDVNGEAKSIPVIWGTQEKAIAAIVQTNFNKDNSNVVQRIKLPMIAVYSSDLSVNLERYAYHRAINYMRGNDGRPGMTLDENLEKDTIFGVARGIPIDVGYQVTVWTLYLEDMDQITEQILRKFSPIAYINVKGVYGWENIVKLDSIANNLETEPGDQAIRVVKFQYSLTAESFIPQPIVRKKAVLNPSVNIVEDLSKKTESLYL